MQPALYSKDSCCQCEKLPSKGEVIQIQKLKESRNVGLTKI